MSDVPSPVVLVHGAWHGPWCWDRVTPLLHARGIETIPVDLPTMNEDARDTSTRDDAAALRAALDALDKQAVIVGHSYGGVVITHGAAAHPMVKRLVYLAAYMPDANQCLNDLIALVPNVDLMRALVRSGDGRLTVDSSAVAPFFYNDCDEATVAWAAERLRPMLFSSGEVAPAAAWRSAPSTYVVCARDRAILPELQRRMAQQADEVIQWDTSHSPFASQPALVADLLERLANA
jgi:pimeloyl-ACP methyl ester carboxylesterase